MFEYFGYNYGILGVIIVVLIWVIIIGAIISLVRAVFDGRDTSWRRHRMPFRSWEKTPLDILKERYAKGEINREEFDQRRADIANS